MKQNNPNNIETKRGVRGWQEEGENQHHHKYLNDRFIF